MAAIIELTGPPGVGKTTLYEAIISKWKRTHNWIPAHHLYPRAKIKFDSFPIFTDSLRRSLLRKIDTEKIREAGLRFVAQNPEYVEAVWNDICLHKRNIHGKDLRFHDATFLYQSFQKAQVLLEVKTEKLALKAEGLVHRIPHSIYNTESVSEQQTIEKLIKNIPLPAGIIYITCDPQENAKRLLTRKFTWEGHKNLSPKQLLDYSRRSLAKREVIIEAVRKQNVPVLTVDSMKGLQQSVKEILSFINTL